VADLLIDTDIFIDHLRGAAELKAARNRLHYSVITRAELFAGNTATDLAARLLAPLREVPVDRAVAERAGRVAREFGLRLPDAIIAATALEHGLQLSTRNTKDFHRVRGLRLRAVR
jgi:predicted nucleic acid-binding protein